MAEQKLEERVQLLEETIDELSLSLSDVRRDLNFLEDMWKELRYDT